MEGPTSRRLPGGGSVRSSNEFRRNPRLWIFPPSLSSSKAHLCLRLSAAWPFAEIRAVDVFGECFEPGFCRLNPDMTVPVLEVEDKVVTGAELIAEFLRERYAGDGDCRAVLAGHGPAMARFADLVAAWDEELYSGGRPLLGTGPLANQLRLARLRQRCRQELEDDAASDAGSSSSDDEAADEEEDESPSPRSPASHSRSGGGGGGGGGGTEGTSPQRGATRELQEAYVRKIAGLQLAGGVGEEQSRGASRSALQSNRRALNLIWATASELLRSSSSTSSGEGRFLFGQELTTADALLVPVLASMKAARPRDFRRYLKLHPAVQRYWARMQDQEEAQVVIGLHAWGLAQKLVVKQMLPCQLLGVKCGCIQGPSLPEEVEERIRKVQAELRMAQA